jgi:hypothetical protein
VGGAGVSAANVWWQTALGEHIPAHALSRVAAWDWIASLALLPVGYAIMGPAAQALGEGGLLLLGAGISGALTAGALIPQRARTALRSPVPARP